MVWPKIIKSKRNRIFRPKMWTRPKFGFLLKENEKDFHISGFGSTENEKLLQISASTEILTENWKMEETLSFTILKAILTIDLGFLLLFCSEYWLKASKHFFSGWMAENLFSQHWTNQKLAWHGATAMFKKKGFWLLPPHRNKQEYIEAPNNYWLKINVYC